MPKYPDFKVRLSNQDGNAFHLISAVNNAMRRMGIPDAEREKFREEAISGDYDRMLKVCMTWASIS